MVDHENSSGKHKKYRSKQYTMNWYAAKHPITDAELDYLLKSSPLETSTSSSFREFLRYQYNVTGEGNEDGEKLRALRDRIEHEQKEKSAKRKRQQQSNNKSQSSVTSTKRKRSATSPTIQRYKTAWVTKEPHEISIDTDEEMYQYNPTDEEELTEKMGYESEDNEAPSPIEEEVRLIAKTNIILFHVISTRW